jgi:hypothetical protein
MERDCLGHADATVLSREVRNADLVPSDVFRLASTAGHPSEMAGSIGLHQHPDHLCPRAPFRDRPATLCEREERFSGVFDYERQVDGLGSAGAPTGPAEEEQGLGEVALRY